MTDVTQPYDWKTGAWKTLKNFSVMVLIPYAIYMLNNITLFIPQNQLAWVLPLASMLSYFLKNAIENGAFVSSQ